MQFNLTLQQCIEIEASIPPLTRFEDMTPEQLYAFHRVEYYTWNGVDYEEEEEAGECYESSV